MPDLADSEVGELLAALASAEDARAAGVASALGCALAASLVELTAALAANRIEREGGAAAPRMREIASEAGQLRRRLPAVADEDVAAYSVVKAAAEGAERREALERASGPPREVADAAARLSRLAAEVVAAGDWPFTADAAAAGRLADAAGEAAGGLVRANRSGASGEPRQG